MNEKIAKSLGKQLASGAAWGTGFLAPQVVYDKIKKKEREKKAQVQKAIGSRYVNKLKGLKTVKHKKPKGPVKAIK